MLDERVADKIRFECEACGREHSLWTLRRWLGHCPKCQGKIWKMVTEYQEGTPSHAPIAILLRVVFGIHVLQHRGELIRLHTPKIDREEALAIAKAPFYKRGRMAFAYMDLRRQLDGAHERAMLREKGGRNCVMCHAFFVPAQDKSWTTSGCCSKSCFAKLLPSLEPAFITIHEAATPETPAVPVVISVRCLRGHEFDVPALYIGVRRPCPNCGEKTLVSL